MVKDAVKTAAAQLFRVSLDRWPPVQPTPQPAGGPGCGVLMPLANQCDQILLGGGGMEHGMIVP